MGERSLWAAVVLQARDDLEFEARGSVIYGHALAFFVHDGLWALSRQTVADHLGLHADDIARLGRATISARNALEGLPAERIQRARKPAADYTPGPVKDRAWFIARFMQKQQAA